MLTNRALQDRHPLGKIKLRLRPTRFNPYRHPVKPAGAYSFSYSFLRTRFGIGGAQFGAERVAEKEDFMVTDRVAYLL